MESKKLNFADMTACKENPSIQSHQITALGWTPVTTEQHHLQQWDVSCACPVKAPEVVGLGLQALPGCLGCGLERWREAQKRCTSEMQEKAEGSRRRVGGGTLDEGRHG